MTPIGWLSLLGVWFLFFWLYRDYRLDYFRQQLFTLRDELFDMAADGKIAFDDPAYGMLRNTINGTIQFGHQLGLLDLLLFAYWSKHDNESRELGNQFENRLEEECKKLTSDTRRELCRIRESIHKRIAEQITFTSFLLAGTLIILVMWFLLWILKKEIHKHFDQCMQSPRMKRMWSIIDCSASMCG